MMTCPTRPFAKAARLLCATAAMTAVWLAAPTAQAAPPSPGAGQGPSGAPAGKAGPAMSPDERGGGDGDQMREQVIGDESSATRNAARTRMRECGHQWSSMKKSGAAAGLTWKEFSQSCLVRK